MDWQLAKALIQYHKEYQIGNWQTCTTCSIAFHGDPGQCEECTQAEQEEFTEKEALARLECERESLQNELQRFGDKMSYTALKLKIRRFHEVNEALNRDND